MECFYAIFLSIIKIQLYNSHLLNCNAHDRIDTSICETHSNRKLTNVDRFAWMKSYFCEQ